MKKTESTQKSHEKAIKKLNDAKFWHGRSKTLGEYITGSEKAGGKSLKEDYDETKRFEKNFFPKKKKHTNEEAVKEIEKQHFSKGLRKMKKEYRA
jgi:hypothetical protein